MMTPNEIGRRIGGSLALLSCVIFGSVQTQTAIAADRATGGNTSGTDACLKANGPGFQWKPALMQSGLMLASQHALRMVQPKTRRELGGPSSVITSNRFRRFIPGTTPTASLQTTWGTRLWGRWRDTVTL